MESLFRRGESLGRVGDGSAGYRWPPWCFHQTTDCELKSRQIMTRPFFVCWFYFKKREKILFYVGNGRGDSGAADRAQNRSDFIRRRVDDNRRSHGRHWPFTWPDKIGRTWRDAEEIGQIGRRKIVHLVVQKDSRLLRDESGAESFLNFKFEKVDFVELGLFYSMLMVDVAETAIPSPSMTDTWAVPWSSGV